MTWITRGRRAVLVAAVAGAVTLLGDPSLGATARVAASGSPGNWSWQPELRRINRGDRIVWTNPTSTSHRVVAYGGNWSKDSLIGSGETTSKRFRRAGLYRYRCTVGQGTPAAHSTLDADGSCDGMCGRIRVRR